MPDCSRSHRAPRLFLSYARDSPAHVEAVRRFWLFLLDQGTGVRIDLSAAQHRRDWLDWMLAEVRDADFVAVIALPEYERHADGLAGPQTGRGVQSSHG
jgi:SEFIR domain